MGMILGSKHVGAILSVLMRNFMFCWLIIKGSKVFKKYDEAINSVEHVSDERFKRSVFRVYEIFCHFCPDC